jgi:hypothetical protein
VKNEKRGEERNKAEYKEEGRRGLLVYASAEGWILIDCSHASIADALFSFPVSITANLKKGQQEKTHSYDIHRPTNQYLANTKLIEGAKLSAQCYALRASLRTYT